MGFHHWNGSLEKFCEMLELEGACVNVKVVDKEGVITKDLALAIYGEKMKREHWVIKDVYLDEVNVCFFSFVIRSCSRSYCRKDIP